MVAVIGKGLAIAVLGRTFGLPTRSAILLGAIMAQVGEFSLILAENGRHLDLLEPRTYNIILGTAVVTIVLSPFVARLGDALVARREARALTAGLGLATLDVDGPGAAAGASRTEQGISADDESRRPTVVVLGAGRVGRVVVSAVRTRGFRCVVVDRDARRLDTVKRLGASTVFGDAANPEILKRLGLDRARVLIVAVGDPLTARLAAERARLINPRLSIASRARGRKEIDTLQGLDVARVADPEAEAAFELARHALQRMGVSGPELNGIVTGLRRDAYGRDRA
jgi:monovalent cation:H+ antiporter-2, CPA2 family